MTTNNTIFGDKKHSERGNRIGIATKWQWNINSPTIKPQNKSNHEQSTTKTDLIKNAKWKKNWNDTKQLVLKRDKLRQKKWARKWNLNYYHNNNGDTTDNRQQIRHNKWGQTQSFLFSHGDCSTVHWMSSLLPHSTGNTVPLDIENGWNSGTAVGVKWLRYSNRDRTRWGSMIVITQIDGQRIFSLSLFEREDLIKCIIGDTQHKTPYFLSTSNSSRNA